ncbi:MAG: cytochrome c biogenesis heme-transporting ATPase CcmA [Betaproteobacteria bacterium]
MTLTVTGLGLTRGSRQLFAGLSLQVEAGEALVLRGANGSGKTSLLRVLAGLTGADVGELRWNGEKWTVLCAGQRATALYLGHTDALKDELTAAENLAEALAFDGVTLPPHEISSALDEAGLAGRHQLATRRLSQGQKRRIGLARLKLSRKPLWLLDEPTNALDAEGVKLFSGVVESHLKRGGLACIATHLSLAINAPIHEMSLGDAA